MGKLEESGGVGELGKAWRNRGFWGLGFRVRVELASDRQEIRRLQKAGELNE